MFTAEDANMNINETSYLDDSDCNSEPSSLNDNPYFETNADDLEIVQEEDSSQLFELNARRKNGVTPRYLTTEAEDIRVEDLDRYPRLENELVMLNRRGDKNKGSI